MLRLLAIRRSRRYILSLRKVLVILVIFSIFTKLLFKINIDIKIEKNAFNLYVRYGLPVTTIPLKNIKIEELDPTRKVIYYPNNPNTGSLNEWDVQIADTKIESASIPKIDGNWTKFHFFPDTDIVDLVQRYKKNGGVAEKPVFPYPYNLTFNNIERCSSMELSFIFLIKSAVENIARRHAIRSSWAMDSELKKHNAIRKFLVGSTNSPLAVSIKRENIIHKDIVEMNFRDSYYNNTLKTIGGIHWVVEHCNRTKFVVMVDDDMFVATPRVSMFLSTNIQIQAKTPFFGGHVTSHPPWREEGTKWYVSREDYPYDVYPDMPSGGFTIMSMPFVIDVHIASQYTKKFIFDDCYMGILAYRLRVKPTHIPTVEIRYVKPKEKFFKTVMAAHGYNANTLKQAWAVLKRH